MRAFRCQQRPSGLVYVVGHYTPKGLWVPMYAVQARYWAAALVSYLNGGQLDSELPSGCDLLPLSDDPYIS
jgi:hypothetical protein